MIEQLPGSTGKILGFKMSGKLHDADYKTFVPMIDDAIAKQGKVRLLAQFHDLQGWDLHALWDDTKFATTHGTKIGALRWSARRRGRSGWRRYASRSRWPKSATSTRAKLTQSGIGSRKRESRV